MKLTMRLINEISKIDRFVASWSDIEKREGQTLKHLKEIETIRSVGASTRIEGSGMTDAEVEVLLSKLKIARLEERNEQEVAGYFEALDTISEHWKNIEITEGNLKNLHNILMKYSKKDEWHRGNYKQTSNAVEATYPDGSKRIIFKTAEPAFETEDAMKKLIKWYDTDKETLAIIKVALFVYDFLSIHPFQDGNGRLSRLLGTLLLLRQGYSWIQYISLEHEIESQKAEYYDVLMQTQKQRPNENVDEWVRFFFSCLLNIQGLLMEKLKTKSKTAQLSPKEKNILAFIEAHPGSRSGNIAKALNMALPTVKKILTTMAEKKIINKIGAGAGVNYLSEKAPIRTELKFELKSNEKKKSFTFLSAISFIEIKRIILIPLFYWTKPNEWAEKIQQQQLGFKVTCQTSRNNTYSRTFDITSFISPYHYQPVIEFKPALNIPNGFTTTSPTINDFPINAEIEILSLAGRIDFDLMFVYDEE